MLFFRREFAGKTLFAAASAVLILTSFNAGIFSYESQQTLKIRNEVAAMESKLAQLKNEYNQAAAAYIENYISAEAFEKAAAEAERKANVQKTMVAVKVGYDTAMTLSSPPKSIKDFLLGKITDAANSASWDIRFEYKLPRPGELPPSADIAYQKALQRAGEKVSWAKSQKAASQGQEVEEGTNEYNFFMFKGFAEGLSEQCQNLRKKQAEFKAQVTKLKSDIEKLESDIAARKQLLGEQIKSDDLYQTFKSQIDKEKAAEEVRQQTITKETSQQLKDGISDASAIDLSSELSEIKSISDKLIGGKVSLEAYREARELIISRADSKLNPPLKTPPGIQQNSPEETEWRKSQKKILEAKRRDFDKNVETIYQNVCDASLKAHETILKMRDELNDIVYDRTANNMKTEVYRSKLSEDAPKVSEFTDYSYEIARAGEYTTGKSYEEELQDLLPRIATTRQQITALKKYMVSADQKYNDYQKDLARQYNAGVTKINEYVKNNFHLLRHENKKYTGIPSVAYLPEADVTGVVSGGVDYDNMLKALDKSEALVKETIAAAVAAKADHEEIGLKTKALNEQLANMDKDFGEKVKKIYERTTIKNLENGLTQLEKDSGAYRSALEKMKDNWIALQILVNYRRDKYLKYPVIYKGFAYYKFGDNISNIDKIIQNTDEKSGANRWDYTAGSTLARFKKKLEEYKKEEELIARELKNYLTKTEGIRDAMKSVYSKNPEQLATSPETAVYFTRTKPPRLDYEKLEKDLSVVFSKKDDFNYFSDNGREFYCGDEVENVRRKIWDVKNEIYKIAYDAGASYEPPQIDWVSIDGRQYGNNTRYDTITIYKADRTNDTIEIKGYVDKSQNLKDIEISIDGGLTYKKGIITTAGADFYGKIDLLPGKTVEIKLKANSRSGDSSSEFPKFGKGIEIFYSTEDATRDLREVINNIAESYESESIFSFMKNISDNFVGQYSTLENAVRNDFSRFDAIRMKFFIDKINISPTMTEGSAEVRWERSWLDSATGKIAKTSGNNYLRFEKSDGKWKLLSYSGTPLFGLSATSTIDSPTGVVVGGTDSEVTLLPVRTGATLRNHYDGGYVYSFVYAREFSLWDESGAPHDIEYKNTTPPVVGAPLSGKIYDFGAVSLDSVTTAPQVFASTEEQAVVGHTYVVVCSNGNYAKFRITDMTSAAIPFDWAYQPDGSTNLR